MSYAALRPIPTQLPLTRKPPARQNPLPSQIRMLLPEPSSSGNSSIRPIGSQSPSASSPSSKKGLSRAGLYHTLNHISLTPRRGRGDTGACDRGSLWKKTKRSSIPPWIPNQLRMQPRVLHRIDHRYRCWPRIPNQYKL
ncbi:hypothetical protein CGRA01v4_15077 [Colletotrichum graminicola]|nr:hypothetical protein CGRA01v4_15077 [Colletotrichum graminicola]